MDRLDSGTVKEINGSIRVPPPSEQGGTGGTESINNTLVGTPHTLSEIVLAQINSQLPHTRISGIGRATFIAKDQWGQVKVLVTPDFEKLAHWLGTYYAVFPYS